jgi:hypothetical protein
MACVDGPNDQCSGDAVLRIDHGVAMTRSGVQVNGRSTTDRVDPATADGLALSSDGVAEIRVVKNPDGVVTRTTLMLRGMGISWDGVTERPPIVDTFSSRQGRVTLDGAGALSFGALPARSDLTFHDYATLGLGGTQANYANNVHFPRSDPSRCPGWLDPCPSVETPGLWYYPHNTWRTNGQHPDHAYFARLHNDGDVHAGDADTQGNPLPGGTGPGVPFPGSKGYRTAHVFGFRYANLAAWLSQDTVHLYEWGGIGEHNTNRRGLVAFGATSEPADMPAAGIVRYDYGLVYGVHAATADSTPVRFRGRASLIVDFGSGRATFVVGNTFPEGDEEARAGLDFDAAVTIGSAGGGAANHLAGPVVVGPAGMVGGVGIRFFGPVLASGTGGTGPAEAGGTFRMAGAGGWPALIGGFVVRKQ